MTIQRSAGSNELWLFRSLSLVCNFCTCLASDWLFDYQLMIQSVYHNYIGEIVPVPTLAPVRSWRTSFRYPIENCLRFRSVLTFRLFGFARVLLPVLLCLYQWLGYSRFLNYNVLNTVTVLSGSLVCWMLLCVCLSIHTRFCFFSSFRSISVCADKFSIYFDKYCIAPRKDFIFFLFSDMFIFVIVSSFFCSLILFWSILCPPIQILFGRICTFWGVVYSLLVLISSLFLLLLLRVLLLFLWLR